ncbi:MAG: hypothetical protein IPM32_06850 [Ignavibacteriae bacterium]|nr:hypothetical protein [Ignavibacteriota bacterium]
MLYVRGILIVIVLSGFGIKSLLTQEFLIDKSKNAPFSTILNDLSNTDTVTNSGLKKDLRKGFVTSSVAPFIGIYGIAYFLEITSFHNTRGDVLLGLAHQNQKTDDGKFNGISLVIGYRQFLYNKLCITEMFYPNYNHFLSSIDGKTYKGFDGFNEISLGWEFEFKLSKKVTLALTPQFTYGQALFRTNPWPKHKDELQKIFFPDVYIGISF